MGENEIRKEVSHKYIVNGKEYARLEDVPEEFKALLQKAEDTAFTEKITGDAQNAQFKVSKVVTKYTVNGKHFNSLEEMPENVRKIFEDKNQNGIPDIVEGSGFKASIANKELKFTFKKGTKASASVTSGMRDPFAAPQQDKLKFILFALIVIGMLVYYFMLHK